MIQPFHLLFVHEYPDSTWDPLESLPHSGSGAYKPTELDGFSTADLTQSTKEVPYLVVFCSHNQTSLGKYFWAIDSFPVLLNVPEFFFCSLSLAYCPKHWINYHSWQLDQAKAPSDHISLAGSPTSFRKISGARQINLRKFTTK
ncbi:hypothetical protein BpHYR1_013954 [Brachionus plicatilis]|uniref:Uncharacterized protein n=1 Tax=Brachionus plicatilis TaxID=10195 RepID=A0A3M7R376_BRAPC|nr:hypothetical protein BpHYR1_013954 [Brachionus plicatilis]